MEKLTHIVLDDFMPPSLQDHIETVTMHENGHALELGHFGKIFGTDANRKVYFAPRERGYDRFIFWYSKRCEKCR